MKYIILTIFIFLFIIYILLNIDFFNNINNKEFIIYFTREEYLPLKLFIQIFENILIKYNYKVTKINNIELIKNNNNINFVIFGLELDDYIINILIKNKIRTIMINTEYYTLFNVTNKINKLNNEIDLYILEYNPINIKNIHSNKITYLPLLYDQYLVDFYNSNIDNKISNKDKTIDILVYGVIKERRLIIINELSKKYNIVCLNSISLDFKELCNYIEKSKIILNLYQHDFNKVFDYYRIAFLISNKIFTINEYPDDIDLNIETNLINFDKYLILAKYENIIETVSKYLDNWNSEEIDNITNKQYEWFKKNTMEQNVINLIKKIN
jgi:hypothetical protein